MWWPLFVQVLNDAVGVVLFNTFAKFVGYSHGVDTVFIAAADFLFIFCGSLVVGYLVGCLAGLATKCVNFRDDKVRKRLLSNTCVDQQHCYDAELILPLMLFWAARLVEYHPYRADSSTALCLVLFDGTTTGGGNGGVRAPDVLAVLCSRSHRNERDRGHPLCGRDLPPLRPRQFIARLSGVLRMSKCAECVGVADAPSFDCVFSPRTEYIRS